MYSPEDILDGAHAIRPHLQTLLPEGAEGIASELDALLARAQQGHAVTTNILRVLGRHDATHDWLDDYIKQKHPDEGHIRQKSFEGVPGKPLALEMNAFRCPTCGYVWHQPFIGIAVPLCPNDQHTLGEVIPGGGSDHALEDH